MSEYEVEYLCNDGLVSAESVEATTLEEAMALAIDRARRERWPYDRSIDVIVRTTRCLVRNVVVSETQPKGDDA